MRKSLIIVLFLIVIAAGIVFRFLNKDKSEVWQKGIMVLSPRIWEEVSFPITITGYVNGDGWIGFEGQVGTVELLSQNGNRLSFAILTAAEEEWMKLPISFEANLEPQIIESGQAVLVFKNENPAGLPENDKEFRLPINLALFEGETTTIKVYFSRTDLNSDCNVVFPVKRTIPKTEAIAKATMEQLLNGPTESEKAQGFFSSINQGVELQRLTIENKTARADFNEQLEFQVGGSCRVAAISAQLRETLKQFPTVENVIISINGRTEDILQP